MNTIKVYGANWCHDTVRTRAQLDDLGVKYEYINIDKDLAANEWITEQNHGKRLTPTVDLGGKILFEPTNEEMENALRASGVLR
jgi:thioredoxin reductase (NADPH)